LITKASSKTRRISKGSAALLYHRALAIYIILVALFKTLHHPSGHVGYSLHRDWRYLGFLFSRHALSFMA
jgi:hypothetical protein